MATKDSRMAQIYRQELTKNRGLLGAFASAGSARLKEAVDLRQYLLPQSGISGVIAQRMFGKAYRYSPGQPGVRTVGSGSSFSDRVVSEKISRIDTNTKLTAKNTIVLPAMARDMNLMRMNMQKMVKLSGGTPSTKADMFFKRAGERESAYESQFKKSSGLVTPSTTTTPTSENKGGIFSGIMNFLKMPLLDMFGGLFSMLIKGGLITAIIAGIGSLIHKLIDDGDFRKSVFKTVDSLLKSVFGEDVWKNLGIGLTAIVGTLAILNTSLSGIVTGIIKTIGLLGKSLFSLVGGISRFLISNPILALAGIAAIGVHEFMEQYIKGRAERQRKGETVGTETTKTKKEIVRGGGRDMQMHKEFELQIEHDEAEIKKIESDIKMREAKGKLSNADKNYIRRKQEKINELKNRISQNKKDALKAKKIDSDISTQDWRAGERGSYNSNSTPTKINTQDILSVIRQKEGGAMGYEAINKGIAGDTPGGYPGLTNLTVEEVMKKQSNKEIMAAGAYQIIPSTLEGLMAGNYGETGVSLKDKFSPEVQDKLATALINKRLQGKNTPEEQLISLANEWAFIADPRTGKSVYAGIAGNASNLSGTNQIMAALGGKNIPISNTPRSVPDNIVDREKDGFSDTIVTAISNLLQMQADTNKQIQTVAATAAGRNDSPSSMIESPYDREAFDALFRFHADIHSSSS